VGGEVRGNYATLNPLALGGSLANGNLDFTSSGSGLSTSTVGVSSGKWYWEVYIGSTPTNTYVGLYDNPNSSLDGYAITGTGGNRFTTAGGTFTVNISNLGLPKGLYFLHVETRQGFLNQKFIVN
jgi:hypothetical protein